MFSFVIEFTGAKPLYDQLYEHIKTRILDRSLKPGEKLPSKRRLAQEMGISSQTVERAYAQLIAEGYITARERSGYFVEQLVALFALGTKTTRHQSPQPPRETCRYDFKTSVVDPERFPYLEWARLEKEIILDDIKNAINTLSSTGYLPLREEIARFVGRYRGIETHPDNIVIGAGGETLIPIIKLLAGSQMIVGVENPGYPKTEKIYRMNGIATIPVPLDEFGLSLNREIAKNANLLHVTPSHQFPTGKVMPISRRLELLEWARSATGRLLVEDDYDSEFRFDGNPIPSLAGLDKDGRVIYLNSFTKSVAPSLRISFMVLPDDLRDHFLRDYPFYTCPVSLIGQVALHRFMSKGLFERHLNRMKIIYRTKRDQLIQSLRESSLHDKLRIVGAEAGLHFLLEFADGVSETELVESARSMSVRVHSLQEYFLDLLPHPPTIVIGYSGLETAAMKKAISILETAWKWL